LSTELRFLVYSAFVLRGLAGAVGYPSGRYDDLPAWAQRAQRAHMNLVENLAPFATLVLVADLIGVSSALTVLGVHLFFWSRLVQTIVMWAGIPWLRTLSFAVGWVGNLLIFWAVLTG
jgi:uncharacterized MAPEG superfamily protein